jgi:hypothetical protein
LAEDFLDDGVSDATIIADPCYSIAKENKSN